MNVRNLYPCQFEELREKINYALTIEELELSAGACICEWNDDDYRHWIVGEISDELVIKSFNIYDFGCDDFFCTAMKYDEYPDREE